MMRHAARHADIWNSLSFLPSFEEQLAETRARCEAIDAECEAIGRDPATLRRSYTMFDAQARSRGGAIGYYESRERFIDQVSRLAELGISDVGLYYPLDADQLGSFETIATEVLPGLRSAYSVALKSVIRPLVPCPEPVTPAGEYGICWPDADSPATARRGLPRLVRRGGSSRRQRWADRRGCARGERPGDPR